MTTVTVYTDEQIAALRRAYASGVLRVEHNGTSTTYRSLAEIKAILDGILIEVGVTGRRTRRTLAVYKGDA